MKVKPFYFIGIALPEPLNTLLSQLSMDLHSKYKGLPPPLLPHITLLHPPSLQDIPPIKIIAEARERILKYLPFNITLESINFFNTQVCYIKVRSPALYEIQSELVSLLPGPIRMKHYDNRAFAAHITIARTRKPLKINKSALLSDIKKAIDLPTSCQINSVSYFERYAPRKYKTKPIYKSYF